MIEASLPRLEFWCDLQSPGCRTALDDVRALRARYGEALPVVLRHFPLERHKHAYAAAEAAEEAFAQGNGWAYAEALLGRVEELAAGGQRVLLSLAGELGLDVDEVELALIDGRHTLAVDADQAEGKAIGVTDTPTYVFDGQRLDGGKSQQGLLERIVELVERHRAGCEGL